MAYSANIPKNRRINRTNDKYQNESYPNNREGLPDNRTLVMQYIPGDPVFLSVEDVAEKTGWSVKAVQKLFNMPDFPSTDFGKRKIVLASSLAAYFSVRRERSDYDGYWD